MSLSTDSRSQLLKGNFPQAISWQNTGGIQYLTSTHQHPSPYIQVPDRLPLCNSAAQETSVEGRKQNFAPKKREKNEVSRKEKSLRNPASPIRGSDTTMGKQCELIPHLQWNDSHTKSPGKTVAFCHLILRDGRGPGSLPSPPTRWQESPS